MNRKRKPLQQLLLSNDGAVKKQRFSTDNLKKRAGIILRMTLKNFMCHSCLDVDLSSNINILIGRNGSGKSAILTALVVGLGGKASLTSRGNSIKGFVKAGKNSGSIEIELYNGGYMAYRPNVYGSSITIVRNISATGCSSYKIKSENGEIISTQVREIHNITTFLNIQVDNPICILNQDTSRNFLSSNNTTHKFQLFLKATKLDTLSNEYKKLSMNRRESVRMYEEKQRILSNLLEELRIVNKKIEDHNSIVNIRDKLRSCKVELLWARVKAAENEVEKEEAKVNTLEQKHQALLNDCATRTERIENLKKSIKEITQQIAELKEVIKVQSLPQEETKVKIDDLIKQYNQKKTERQLITNTIQSKNKDAAVLQTEIANANENMSRVEKEKMNRLRDLTSFQQKMKGMDDHLQTCRNDLYQFSSDVARRDEERNALKNDILRIDQQIIQERNSINALTNESENTLLLYGRDIPKVKQMIEKYRKKFTHVPRGPLGSYIKLKDKKWAIAVESFLTSGLLGSFIVNDIQDNALLTEIFNQVWTSGRKPTIITSAFFYEKHDVSRNKVQAPNDCIGFYDAVEIDDSIVSNCIVDQAAIESLLLIPTNERAIQLMSNAAQVPYKCKQAVTIKGDRYYPDPNYKTYGSRYHRPKYLQVDTKEYIGQLEQNLIELSNKKQGLETHFNNMSVDIRDQEAKKRTLEEKIRKLNAARGQIRQQLESLKATAEPEVVNVEMLENELAEIKKNIEEKNAQLTDIEQDMKQRRQEIRNKEEELKQLKNSSASLEDRLKLLLGQIQENKCRQSEITTSDEFDKRKSKECEMKLNEARDILQMKQVEVKQCIAQAENVGERMNTKREVTTIIREINMMESSVRKMENNVENVEDLVEKRDNMNEKHEQGSQILQSLNNDINDLNTAIDQRKRHYAVTESYFTAFIKHSFQQIMEVRQFKGFINIDMQDKKLDLVVIPQHGSQGQTNSTNLSGGEKSFSTVAFLYSLWQCMEFPFYFLDEFDVYMDKLNRTKVIEILLHHAKSHPELQFVFLTPQDVSFIKNGVSILRLSDPERTTT